MRQHLAAGAAGLVFALGLGLAGMTRPEKVIGFLDFFGAWDPALVFVMGGAVMVGLVAFRVVLRRQFPYFARAFSLPTARHLDAKLLGGAALFGIGWGLAGFCPGPALTNLASGLPQVGVFVVTMLGGMWLYGRVAGVVQARAAVYGVANPDAAPASGPGALLDDPAPVERPRRDPARPGYQS